MQYYYIEDAPSNVDATDAAYDSRIEESAPKSITRFLQLPSVIDKPIQKKCIVDPNSDFSKSILVTSKDYIRSVQQKAEEKAERVLQKEQARQERQATKKKGN